jgi:predicted amidohydrolase
MVGRGVRFVHRKCHRTSWELKHCRAGTSLEVPDIGPAKVGTLICYDSAFPAAAETLVRRGAEILIQPSCHGMSAKAVSVAERAEEIRKRKRHVEKYWGARAYDYTCYAIYVNHAGENARGNWFPNYVGVFGPDGEVIAETVTEGEQMVIADLSGSFLEKCRKDRIGHFAMMGDARPELYWTYQRR